MRSFRGKTDSAWLTRLIPQRSLRSCQFSMNHVLSQKWLSCLMVCFCLIGLAGCRAAGTATKSASEDKEDTSPVIVEINGSPEHSSAFERFIKSHLSDFYAQSASTQPGGNNESRSRLFDEFVRRQLIVHEARKHGVTASPDEIAQAVQSQRQQLGAAGESSGQEQNTLTSNERAAEITSELLTIKYYQQAVLKDVKVSPDEVGQYYEQNKNRYQKNGFYVREIRVTSRAEAQQLHQQALARPADFATLAREHSQAPNATNGGLTYYEVGQLPAVLEQEILPLKIGGTSRVVQSSYGFHIFRLEKKAEPLPFEKLKKQLEDELLSRKNQDLIDGYTERLLSSAQIRIYYDRLGFDYVGNLKQAKKGS